MKKKIKPTSNGWLQPSIDCQAKHNEDIGGDSRGWTAAGVWRYSGEAHNPSRLSSSGKFPQLMTIWWVRPPEGAVPLCFIKSKVRTVISELKVLFILIFDKRNWICVYLPVCSLFGCALSLFLQAAAAHPTSLGKPIYGNQLSQTDAGSFSYRLVIRPQSLHVQLLWFPVLTSCFFYRKLFVGLLTSELWFVTSSVASWSDMTHVYLEPSHVAWVTWS